LPAAASSMPSCASRRCHLSGSSSNMYVMGCTSTPLPPICRDGGVTGTQHGSRQRDVSASIAHRYASRGLHKHAAAANLQQQQQMHTARQQEPRCAALNASATPAVAWLPGRKLPPRHMHKARTMDTQAQQTSTTRHLQIKLFTRVTQHLYNT
jgi:hypothetical protein